MNSLQEYGVLEADFERRTAQLRDKVKAHLALLADPVAIQMAMLRGTIAKISMLQCAHTHGEEMVTRLHRMEAMEEACAAALEYLEALSFPHESPTERHRESVVTLLRQALTKGTEKNA